MALRIRLRQQGKKNYLTYRLVVADSRAPRDGKYLEMLGYYDPHLERDTVLFEDRLSFWIDRGAQVSEKGKSLLRRSAPGLWKSMTRGKKGKRVAL